MNYWKVLLVGLASAGLAVASCSHPGGTGGTGTGGSNGTGGSGDCPLGSLGCPCIGTTCDQDLACADLGNGKTECVTTSGSTGGAPGTGGSVATGGAVGTGGTPATGGNGPGTGGSPGTGGGPGTGGNPGTGGGPSGPNLLANGDFSQADTNWHFENGAASVNNGQYCTTSINASALFGWQNMSTPLVLMNGQSYTLSYRASGSNNAVLHIKVAHAVSPYTPDDYETNPDDKLSASLQTFTHTFTPTTGTDDNTGVAFFVMAGQNICIASVSLVAN